MLNIQILFMLNVLQNSAILRHQYFLLKNCLTLFQFPASKWKNIRWVNCEVLSSFCSLRFYSYPNSVHRCYISWFRSHSVVIYWWWFWFSLLNLILIWCWINIMPDALKMILNHLKHEHFINKNWNHTSYLPHLIILFINLQLVPVDNSSINYILNH